MSCISVLSAVVMAETEVKEYHEDIAQPLKPAHIVLIVVPILVTVAVVVVQAVKGLKRGIHMPALLMLVMWTALVAVGLTTWAVTYVGPRSAIIENTETLLVRAATEASHGLLVEFSVGAHLIKTAQDLTSAEFLTGITTGYPDSHKYFTKIMGSIEELSDAILMMYVGTDEGRMFGVMPKPDTHANLQLQFLGTKRGDALPQWASCGRPANTTSSSLAPTVLMSREGCYPQGAEAVSMVYVNSIYDEATNEFSEAPAGVDRPLTHYNYSVKELAWYNDKAPQWIEPYTFTDNSGMGVTLSAGLYNADRAVLGSVAVDYNLASFNRYLRKMKVTENTVSFLITLDTILVGSSLSEEELEQDTGMTRTNILQIQEFKADSMARKVVDAVLDRHGSLENAEKYQSILQEGGDIMLAAPLKAEHGLRLILLLSMPYSDVLGKADSSSLLALWLAVIISIVGAALVFIGVSFIIAPLKQLERDMDDVADMKLDRHDAKRHGIIAEVNAMHRSFRRMVKHMKEYRQYLPQSVLRESQGDSDISRSSCPSCPSRMVSNGSRLEPESDLRHQSESSKISKASGSSKGSLKSMTSDTSVRVYHHAFKNGLKNRNITLVVVNGKGFHSLARRVSATSLLALHAHYLETVVHAVKDHRGIIDEFRGDHVHSSFNTLIHNSLHRGKAVEMCLKLRSILNRGPTVPTPSPAVHNPLTPASRGREGTDEISLSEAADTLRVTQTVMGGRALCGNMGCIGLKRFSLIGSVLPAMAVLERWVSGWGYDVVADGLTAMEVQTTVTARCILQCTLPEGVRTMLYELVTPKPSIVEEWMYQLEQSAATTPFLNYNKAVEALYSGHFDLADEHLDRCPAELTHFVLHARDVVTRCRGTGEGVMELTSTPMTHTPILGQGIRVCPDSAIGMGMPYNGA